MALYRPDQVRALDELAIERAGVTGYELMMRAGARVWQSIRACWPEAQSITVCCGGGNNGGDGWVVAGLAHQAGWRVQVVTTHDPLDSVDPAHEAFLAWCALTNVPQWTHAEATEVLTGEVVVDALLGTGFEGTLKPKLAKLIDWINIHPAPVVSVDVPSGLNAETGMAHGPCVVADLTLSFVAQKRGLFTAKAGRHTGRLVFCDLGIGSVIERAITPDAHLLSLDDLAWLPKRWPDAHKGLFGRVAVIGGAEGMVGAPVMTGLAALQTGSGWVTVMGGDAVAEAACQASPALMSARLTETNTANPPWASSDVVAIGPGLGQGAWGLGLLQQVLKSTQSLVVDADGLNLMAKHRLTRHHTKSPWILTPHPAEAARLLSLTTEAVEADRFAAVRRLSAAHQAVVVLKGFGTLIAHPDGRVWVCPFGTPAMASAGMGDALTGIIASLWGQGLADWQAACLGVMVHALSGEVAAKHRRQITAPDLIQNISEVMAISH